MEYYTIQSMEFTSGNIVLGSIPKKSIITGEWEDSEVQLCKKYLRAEDRVLELGGCIGVVSCFVNTMLASPECHVVVEANPQTSKVLELNKARNDCQFLIENCLVFRDHDGKYYPASGAPQSGSTMIHNDGLREDQKNQFEFDVVQLPVTTVEDLQKKHKIDFNVLIMDIEGGEFQFIKENVDFLSTIELAVIEFHHRFNIDGCNEAEYLKAVQALEKCGLVSLKNEVKYKGRMIETATEVWGRP